MRNLFAVLAAFLAVILFAPVSHGAATGMAGSYSADLETQTQKETVLAKIYGSNGKQRMESNANNRSGIMIIRPDKKAMWMLMPDKNMYMEMSLEQRKDMPVRPGDTTVKFDKTFIGNETVDGHPAKKYHIKVQREGKMEDSGYMWEATDLHNFPIKFQSEDKSTTTVFKNIKLGTVSATLFEVPAGYNKMNMPMGMPGGMGDMSGMGGMKRPRR